MLDWKEEPVRWQIADRFGYWTAQRAMRGWNQGNVDVGLGQLDFAPLFDTGLGRIEKDDFDRWFIGSIFGTQKLGMTDNEGNAKGAMPLGWVAKMINIYLKETCYLAGFGRDNLDNVIHPPIDRRLVRNLKRKFRGSHLVQNLRAFESIEGLNVESYYACIGSCKLIADKLGCRLIEVEQFWTPT